MARSKPFSGGLLIAALIVAIVFAFIVGSARPARATAYSTAITALGPVAYYRLNESSGTTAADATGNGHTGTYADHGSTGTSLIAYSQASLVLDTDTSAAFKLGSVSPLIQGEVQLPSSGWPTITNYTVVLWVKTSASPGAYALYQWGCSGVGVQNASIIRYTNCSGIAANIGSLSIPAANVTPIMAVVTSGNPATQGTWINGVRLTSSLPPAPNPTGTNVSAIGLSLAPGSGTMFCNVSSCNYDEVAFFDYTLSASDIANLYAIGRGGTPGIAGSFLGVW